MPLDRTTDAITHFIGLFHVDVEAGRMRDWYDAFRVEHEENKPEDHPEIKITLNAPYKLKKHEVDTKVKLPPEMIVASDGLLENPLALPYENTAFSFEDVPEPYIPPASGGGSGGGGRILQISGTMEPQVLVPLPNSIMTVTVQVLYLTDDDFLSFYHDYDFADPSVYSSQLTELAESLSLGLSEVMVAGHLPATEALMNIIEAAQDIEYSTDEEDAYATVHHGESATGIYINGVQAEDMPDFLENMPVALQKDEDDADDVPYDGPPGHEDHANPYEIEEGHHVETGENLSVNETFVYSNWVDAGVIGVMGDVVQLDIISQINILSEHDIGGGGGAVTASWALNAAQIIAASTEPVEAEQTEEESDEQNVTMLASDDDTDADAEADIDEADIDDVEDSEPLVFPSYWNVARVEGDVVAMNWVQQHIFATDHDRAEIEFSGYNTQIGMGENILSNFTTMVELGFHYDLIIVGGSMITINMIEQINVLLDSDTITGSTWAADAIDTGGNYLQNSASIEHTGIDTVVEMSNEMMADAEALADGAETVSTALATDEVFEGLETLSVLYIEGDLVEFNAIEQHNYVGDADQVYLALDEFVADATDHVTVATGENALLNAATIHDDGIDSTVMAAGEVYSDALIHQAGLIDDAATAVENGVAMAELSSEAVAAFLANSMIDAQPELPEEIVVQPLEMESSSMDVMQTLLA
ncbi:hypothetical protein [Roseovarius sp. EL26]|uniref:hypothetical protein n=1 Tax=Roseovarius sp. EL26 TaxID=2126672 RepID=UPI000EA17ED5|nr:hypothetical protein [Roseovarius sp. EL26]